MARPAPRGTEAIQVKIDEATLRSVRKRLSHVRDGFQKAVASAINDALTREIKPNLRDMLFADINLPKDVIARAISITKATRNNLTGYVNVKKTGYRIISPEGKLMYRGSKEIRSASTSKKLGGSGKGGIRKGRNKRFGILAKLYRNEPPVLIRAGFEQKATSDGHRVFMRRKEGSKKRYPVRHLLGISPYSSLLKAPGMMQKALTNINEVLLKRLESKVDAVLAGKIA